MEDMLDLNASAPGCSMPCETDDDVMPDLNAPTPESSMTEVSVGDNLTISPEASVDVGGLGYKSPSMPIEDDSTAAVTAARLMYLVPRSYTLIDFHEGTSMGQPISAMNPNDTSLKFASYMLLSQLQHLYRPLEVVMCGSFLLGDLMVCPMLMREVPISSGLIL